MCQTCVDEGYLSQETFDRIEAFANKWPMAEFGPAHLVIADCNVSDADLEEGIAGARRELAGYHELEHWMDHSTEELEATVVFLTELLAVPEGVR